MSLALSSRCRLALLGEILIDQTGPLHIRTSTTGPTRCNPFGHGLSYTEFAYSDLRISADNVVSMTLTNTGARPGSEVVQLYVRTLNARYEAPRLRLADFRKVRLAPGATRELTFRLAAEHLARWDVTSVSFAVDPGDYEVLVGRSAGELVLGATITAGGPVPGPRTVVDRRTSAVDFDDYTGITLVDASRSTGDAIAPSGRPATVLFRSAGLSGAARVEAEVAGEGRLAFTAGDRLLAEIAVPDTGGATGGRPSPRIWTRHLTAFTTFGSACTGTSGSPRSASAPELRLRRMTGSSLRSASERT
ncbi:fibronectin type III-like domain-contianing protein [Nonomuraea sp. JJY05]|uniref:fibronectin type III-like domain-contianing protein n=1 Tax=Nonomuraea sp. JJY05 TaxID=3350255 RepID=UPI00373EC50A